MVEAKGIRLLSDPWWEGACFGSQWWLYPRCDLGSVNRGPIDYIYISHGHADHLHPGTLRRLPKSARCLVSSKAGISDTIRQMGFEVLELAPGEIREIGNGVRAEIMPTHGDDTLMALSDGEEAFVNLNDAVHSTPRDVEQSVINALKARYPQIDYAFCGYGTASHFPNCYIVPGADRVQTAVNRQKHFNRRWSSVMARLAPRHGFPFAASVVFLDEDLEWLNESIHNAERPTDVFRRNHPNAATVVYDVAPGFAIEGGRVTRSALFEPVKNETIRAVYADAIANANKVSVPSTEDIADLAKQIISNVALCQRYLQEFRSDYRFLIEVRGASIGISITKRGNSVSVQVASPEDRYDLRFKTRYSYLRRVLSHAYGHEIIFVGSGGIFEYSNPVRVKDALHRELAVLLRKRTDAAPSRFGTQSAGLYMLKTMVKRLFRKTDPDLYSLSEWLRYTS
jgi:L-ascorbate metabolism protein UlaG (beta-lactamase superfamily)